MTSFSPADVITSVRARILPAGVRLSLGHDATGELWSAPVASVQLHPDCRSCTDPDLTGAVHHDLHVHLTDGTVIGIRDNIDAIRYRRPWDAPRRAAAA